MRLIRKQAAHALRVNAAPLIILLSLLLICGCHTAAASEIVWKHVATEQGVELYSPDREVGEQLPFKAITVIQAPYHKVVMSLVDHERKVAWAPKLKSTMSAG